MDKDKYYLMVIGFCLKGHRKNVFITCPPSCWCWKIVRVLDEEAANEGVQDE